MLQNEMLPMVAVSQPKAFLPSWDAEAGSSLRPDFEGDQGFRKHARNMFNHVGYYFCIPDR